MRQGANDYLVKPIAESVAGENCGAELKRCFPMAKKKISLREFQEAWCSA
jgi:hypothetical protein